MRLCISNLYERSHVSSWEMTLKVLNGITWHVMNPLEFSSSYLFWIIPPVLFKVHCCDHTYTTIRVPVAASVREVIDAAADKLGSAEGLILVGLSSAGGESSCSDVRSKWLETGNTERAYVLFNNPSWLMQEEVSDIRNNTINTWKKRWHNVI